MTDPSGSQEPRPESLHIGWDDLDDPNITQHVEQMRAAQQVPLVRQIGDPEQARSTGLGRVLGSSLGGLTVAGLGGALVAWGLLELVVRPDAEKAWYGDGVITGSIVATLAIGLGIAWVIAAWDGLQARSLNKTMRALGLATAAVVPIGLLGGWIAGEIYKSMTKNILEEAYNRALDASTDQAQQVFFDYVASHLHLPRGIAFAVVGLCVGVALGAASLAWRRALNGAIGGFIGGFVGGFLFDYIGGPDSTSGAMSRLVAMIVTGLLIGISVGLIETASRSHWLEILSGGMAGKQFILYNNQTVVGSASECQVTLIKDPAIPPRQGLLIRSGPSLSIRSLDPMSPVLVNGISVKEQRLNDSDVLHFGSSLLRYRARQTAASVSNTIHG